MREAETITFLQKQVESLERERMQALEALELASSLGNFESSYFQQEDVGIITAEICRRANLMVEFASSGVYLFTPETNDLGAAHYDDPAQAGELDAEVEALIGDYSFSYAMQVERPCFFLTRNKSAWTLLHVLATPARIRAMFVGVLKADKNDIPDTTLSLFTVVMMAGANALESFELNKRFREHRQELERTIEARTKSLHETNRQLETIVNNIHAGVMLVDAQRHTILDINPAALKMLGIERETVIGHLCHRFVCPAQEHCCPVTDLGQVVDNAERVLINSSGEEVPILKTVTRIQMEDRECLLEVFMDMTEQKKVEYLKADIERMTRHDLKTPLNGIIGLPDIILECVPPDDEVREMLQAIKDSGLKMLKLINMSLDMYKMETGKYLYSPVEMNALSVVRALVREFESLAKPRNKRFEILLDGAPAAPGDRFALQAEEMLLYSLLGNLMKNAVEASPPDSVVRVELTSGETPKIAVSNRGAIDPKVKASLFKKYATSKKEGTGLGLYSVQLIVCTMGARITLLEDEPDVVRFEIVFPSSLSAGGPACSLLA
ncbi:hypothetical protein JCM15519_35910 [Fundidesulfovibrio butyratiphilus]